MNGFTQRETDIEDAHHRALRNKASDHPRRHASKAASGSENRRVLQEGEMDAAAWSCGMVAGLIHDIPTCKELIDRIMQGAEEIISRRLEGLLAA